MRGSDRFSQNSLKLIASNATDGETMIAVSRAILRNFYSDDEYERELFSIFILIDDESGDIVLNGFGEFDVASGRHKLHRSHIANVLSVFLHSPPRQDVRSNIHLCRSEINEIEISYREIFLSSLNDFREFFGLEGLSGFGG